METWKLGVGSSGTNDIIEPVVAPVNVSSHSVPPSPISATPPNSVGNPERQDMVVLPGFNMQRTDSTESDVSAVSSSFSQSNLPVYGGHHVSSVKEMLGRLRNPNLSREFWLKDEHCQNCFLCGDPFTAFRRKHHCRMCGRIFDSKCTSLTRGRMRDGAAYNLRACKECKAIIDEFENASDDESGSGLDDIAVDEASFANDVRDRVIQNIDERYSIPQSMTPKNIPLMAIPAVSWETSDSNKRRTAVEFPALDYSRSQQKSGIKRSESMYSSMGRIRRNSVIANDLLSSPSNLPRLLVDDDEITQEISTKSSDQDDATLDNVAAETSRDEGKSFLANLSRRATHLFDGSPKFENGLLVLNNGKSFKKQLDDQISTKPPGRQRSNSTPQNRPRSRSRPHRTTLHDLPSKPLSTTVTSTELNAASVALANTLLRQMLRKVKGANVESWERVLYPILTDAASKFSPDLQIGDKMDIKEYIKVKKLPGGNEQDSKYVEGFVFTKSLALKQMPRRVKDPRIMIITFPIDIYYSDDQFLSLDPAIAQGKDYLQSLISRILSYRPNVLLVANTVSGIALEHFAKADVAVFYNLKSSVVDKAARYTGATIITSSNRLALVPNLGTCGEYYIRTVALNSPDVSSKKSLVYLRHCPFEVGSTIILRGKYQELSDIKPLVVFMSLVFYHLRLETSFFRDQFAIMPTKKVEQSAPTAISENSVNHKKSYRDIINEYASIVLSMSSCTEFPPPFLLNKCYEAQERVSALQEKLPSKYRETIAKDIHKFMPLCSYEANLDEDNPSESDLLLSFEYAMATKVLGIFEQLWESFQHQNGDLVNPITHQNIIVLFSDVCASTSVPCHGPEIALFEYYEDTDYTLGQYVTDLIGNAGEECDVCGKLQSEHFKSYVHGQARLSAGLESFSCPFPGMENSILMWSYCRDCKLTTPVIPMSDLTWRYSFGKYLETGLYSREVLCRATMCPHDMHKRHVRYFGLHNWALRFQYDPADLLTLAPPERSLTYDPAISMALKKDEFEAIELKITRFYESVNSRLENFPFDCMSQGKLEQAKEKVDALIGQGKEESEQLFSLLTSLSTRYPFKSSPLNRVIRALQENAVSWDMQFIEFGKEFMFTEKEIKSVTAAQLKKLFADRDISNLTLKNGTLEEVERGHKAREKSTSSTDSRVDKNGEESDKKELKVKDGNEDSVSLSPKLQPVKSSKVQQIADQFDKLAREFTSEHMKTTRFSTGNPRNIRPVKASRPVVEIFENVEDAFKDGTDVENEESKCPQQQEQPKLDDSNQDSKQGNLTESALKSVETLSMMLPPPVSDGTNAVSSNEKGSIVKAIANLWLDRAAPRWEPLAYPLNVSSHVFSESDIIVREDEPSSLIAFTLSSVDYRTKLHAIEESNRTTSPTIPLPEVEPTSLLEGSVPSNANERASEVEGVLLRETSSHLKYQFREGSSSFFCKIFYAEQFEAIRKHCGCEAFYIESLSRCLKWDSLGGKSGSAFLKTKDDRFVVKEMTRYEIDAFINFAPAYFQYLSQAFFHDLPTVLARIFGFYQIGSRNSITGKTTRLNVLVMENLFYKRKISRIFDLKGSMRNRHVEATGKENEVLLDENLVEFIYESPLFLREYAKRILRASLWNDTLFLAKMNVMDYSLVVGIDDTKHELVVGIIDFIRTFTWDKKLESWVKERGLVGGGSKEPTVVTPRQYKNRFRESMERYFLMVPSCWHQFNLQYLDKVGLQVH